jgi:RNA polymerase sigma-70 factor (ECF subfamily)
MLDFHDLYQVYAPEVYRFAYWLTGDALEAEDLTAETFVRAWIHAAAIRTETLKAYLLAIARNLYLEQLRKRRPLGQLEDWLPDPGPGPETQAETRAELECAHRLLQALPEIDRAALILRVQHDLPYAEIARVLQMSVAAVKVKVHRARLRLLKARLGEEVLK